MIALKPPHILLEITQDTPRHVLTRREPQIRITRFVYAYRGPHRFISARDAQTTVLHTVCKSFSAARYDSRKTEWRSVCVKLNSQA